MKLYDDAVNMLKTLIPFFKEEGASDKTISGGFDYAEKILNKFPLEKEKKDALLKALDEVRKGMKK